MSDAFEILYAAHTATCTFLLDSEGICRRIALVPNPKRGASPKGKDAARAATRCVGAQYVASLDPTVSGMLAEMPRVGAAMLFARVDDGGRVSLVRTGVVTRFEGHRDDPFANGSAAPGPAPSASVETSAPVLTPPVSTVAHPRNAARDAYRDEREKLTEPIATVRNDERGRPGSKPSFAPAPPPPPPPRAVRAIRPAPPSDDSLAETRAYAPKAAPARDPRWTTLPSAISPPQAQTATLRQPPVMPLEDDLDDDYAPPRPPPRRSEPVMTRPRSPVPLPSQTGRPGSYPILRDAVAVRRRGER